MSDILFSKTLFRDVDIKDLDLKVNRNFIIERALIRGGMNDVKKMMALYTKAEIVHAIKQSRDLDKITHNCCAHYFNIPKTAMHAPSQYY